MCLPFRLPEKAQQDLRRKMLNAEWSFSLIEKELSSNPVN